jgi:hypothetical protein
MRISYNILILCSSVIDYRIGLVPNFLVIIKTYLYYYKQGLVLNVFVSFNNNQSYRTVIVFQRPRSLSSLFI